MAIDHDSPRTPERDVEQQGLRLARTGCAFAGVVAIVIGLSYRHFGIGVVAGMVAFGWYAVIAVLRQTRSVNPWLSIGGLVALAALLAEWRIARGDSVDNAIQFATLIPIAVGFIGGVLIHRFEEAGGGEQLRRGGVLAWIGMAAAFVIGIPVAALYNRLGVSHSPNPVVPNTVEVPIFTAALGAGLGATLALRRLRHGQGPPRSLT